MAIRIKRTESNEDSKYQWIRKGLSSTPLYTTFFSLPSRGFERFEG